MSNKSSFKEKFKLFLFFLNDIENYLKIKSEIQVPTNIADLLNPITSNTSLFKLIKIKNDKEYSEKIEKKKKPNQKIQIKEKTEEDEELRPFLRVINSKSAINPTCFNQCSMYNAHLIYNCIDERRILNHLVTQKMKKMINESYYWVYESIKYSGDVEDDFVFKSSRQHQPKVKKEVQYANSMYNKNNNDLRKIAIMANNDLFSFSKKEKKCPSRKTSRNLKSSINRLTLPKDNKFISNTETFLPKVKKYKDPNDKEVGYCSKKVMEEKLIKQFDYSELLALRTGTVKIRKMQMTAKPKAKLLFHIEDNKTNTYRSPYNNI